MTKRWFGQFDLPMEATGYWQVGPYQLWMQRTQSEIKVASLQGSDPTESEVRVEVPSDGAALPEDASIRRFGFHRTAGSVTVAPALADRPVVVSPQEPLHLPPKQRVTLFISTPIWVQVTIGGESMPLVDEPTHRPTDTWFGPSTMKGEVCYATKTAARLTLENLPSRPHRVATEVEINNRSEATLSVERLKIPFIHLSVYATSNHDLWTETVAFDHVEEGDMASVQLAAGPPVDAAGAVQVSGPRKPMDSGLLTRAFGRLEFLG